MTSATRRAPHQGRLLWAGYGVLGAVLLAYLVSLLVRGDNSSELVDGWLVAAFELTGSAAVLPAGVGAPRSPGGAAGARVRHAVVGARRPLPHRGIRRRSALSQCPSLADVFYLGFYPLLYVGLVLMVRRQARELTSAMWLDGLVAGLGAAGVCACFLFSTLVRTTGADPAAVATNLAYPIGDLLLLALVVGVTAILPGRRSAQWILLALACAINAAGDTANLLRTPGSGWGFANVFDAVAWPTAILLISLALWLPAREHPARRHRQTAGHGAPRAWRRRRAGHPALRLVPSGQLRRGGPGRRHADGGGGPLLAVGRPPAHAHPQAAPPGGHRRPHRVWATAASCSTAQRLLRRRWPTRPRHDATSASSSSTSTISRRSTTPSVTPPATSCSASSGRDW